MYHQDQDSHVHDFNINLSDTTFKPAHEIMALFDFHSLILQTHMLSHPVGLDVWFLVEPIICFLLHVYEQQWLASLPWLPLW